MLNLRPYLDEIAAAIGEPAGSLKLIRYRENAWSDVPDRPTEPLEKIIAKPPVTVHEGNTCYAVKHPQGHYVTWFNLQQLPGCCAFCLSHGVRVATECQLRGVNTIAMRMRERIAEWAGYSAIICTDVEKNVAQRKTLARNGWKDIYDVVNARTGNNVIVSVKRLNPTENLF